MKPFNEPVYVTRPLFPELKEFERELEDIWGSQWLTNLGPKHKRFEEEITRVLKVPCASLFNNGTTALLAAFHILQLSGEVITTPFTFAATPHVLAWNNITPVFCDIDDNTMNIDAQKIERMITPETTGILAVHIFGTPCEVGKIQDIADRHGLRVIYDAAHAFGTLIDGQGIGNFGDMTMFSFHATKLFHTAEGGALTFKDVKIKHRIDLLKNFGIENEEEVSLTGINGKLNEIQAALGLVNLRYMEGEIIKRKKISDTYRLCLSGLEGITLSELPDNVQPSYQYFVIRVDRRKFGKSRDNIFKRLREYNVHARKYFYPLCSDYACYKHLPSSNPDNLPIAGKVAKEVLCLPFYGNLDIPSVEKICEIIRECKKR
jgi:dTDP-4-amino-4,6-dideoxygalactose transaminase